MVSNRSPTTNRRCTPTTTQQNAFSTRTLRMDNCEKCWLHHCKSRAGKEILNLLEHQKHQGNQKQNDAEGASAQRTQADHSRRDSLMSSSSQEPRASGKPDALFSPRSDEPGNQFESSVFKFADPANVGKSLLDGNKDRSFAQSGKI